MLSSIASYILSIQKFFGGSIGSYDKFFEDAEDYLSKSITNGKVFYDLGEFQKKIFILGIKFIVRQYKSPSVQAKVFQIDNLVNLIKKIPIIDKLCSLFVDIHKHYLKFSKYFLLFLFFGIFPIVITLLQILNASPAQFFIFFIPIFLILLFLESGLFIFIEKHENDDNISLARSFLLALENFESVILIFLFYILLCGTLLLSLASLLSLSTQIITMLEGNTILLFIYLLIILFLCISILFFCIYLSILVYQAYFIALLEKKNSIQSLVRSGFSMRKNILDITIFSVVFYLSTLLLAFFAFIYLSDIALQFIITLILHSQFLFTYSIRKKLLIPRLDTKELPHQRPLSLFFIFFLFVGIIGCIAFASQILRYYPSVSDLYAAWQYDRELEREFKPYINSNNNYSILYPKNWNVHNWNNNSVTIHHNVNNTSSGRISVNISVLSVSETNYFRLDSVKPGTVIFDKVTTENTIKLSNLLLGGHDAIKYSVIIPFPDFTEYQINYLVLNGDKVFKISFVSVDSVFQQTYTKIFETMINSFRFTKLNDTIN